MPLKFKQYISLDKRFILTWHVAELLSAVTSTVSYFHKPMTIYNDYEYDMMHD